MLYKLIDYGVYRIFKLANRKHSLPEHYMMPSPFSAAARHYMAFLEAQGQELRDYSHFVSYLREGNKVI